MKQLRFIEVPTGRVLRVMEDRNAFEFNVYEATARILKANPDLLQEEMMLEINLDGVNVANIDL